jgi:predicted nucleotidyltransferase
MSIAEITQQILPILEEYHVEYAGIFGSFARGEDTKKSDVDLLVEVDKPIGIYKFMELRERLEGAIGRNVDLVSKNALNKNLKSFIEHDLITLYDKR